MQGSAEIPSAQPQLSTNEPSTEQHFSPCSSQQMRDRSYLQSVSEQEASPGNEAGCALWGHSPGYLNHLNLTVWLLNITTG